MLDVNDNNNNVNKNNNSTTDTDNDSDNDNCCKERHKPNYLFLKGWCFPRVTLLENCSLCKRDNICRQIPKLFLCQIEAIVYILGLHCHAIKNNLKATRWIKSRICDVIGD